MPLVDNEIDLTDYHAVLEQRKLISNTINHYPADSIEYAEATMADSKMLDTTVPIRILALIGGGLDHQITEAELAHLIVASAKHEDISEVLSISPEIKMAIKFQQARRIAHMTQADVAAKTNISQSQIAKAELGQTALTLTHWVDLFKAVNGQATLKFA
ncbi:helix-turn-helix domain-containing protein [Loigolactobacillus zhaoyuanensis]|uniref:Helix-turn-helix domain-containing protein n=1 Tax=Loigolactobacillus zhaoyuanensis TaxID=2486017 RepID=A0ABW8UCU4_9LACO|nr:helix-turn-helix transcriptional regulator [Loigolactobacillus zhaoyuanensis]